MSGQRLVPSTYVATISTEYLPAVGVFALVNATGTDTLAVPHPVQSPGVTLIDVASVVDPTGYICAASDVGSLIVPLSMVSVNVAVHASPLVKLWTLATRDLRGRVSARDRAGIETESERRATLTESERAGIATDAARTGSASARDRRPERGAA